MWSLLGADFSGALATGILGVSFICSCVAVSLDAAHEALCGRSMFSAIFLNLRFAAVSGMQKQIAGFCDHAAILVASCLAGSPATDVADPLCAVGSFAIVLPIVPHYVQ